MERVIDMPAAGMDATSPAIGANNFGEEVIVQGVYFVESNPSASAALHHILTVI